VFASCHPGCLLCLTCGKALADRAKLAQHLKDAHRGINAAPAQHAPPAGRNAKPSSSFSLADVLEAKLRRVADAARPPSPDKAPPAPPPAKPRGVQGTLKVPCLHLSAYSVCMHLIQHTPRLKALDWRPATQAHASALQRLASGHPCSCSSPANDLRCFGCLQLSMGGGLTPEEAVLCGTERSNAARKRPTAVKRGVLRARAARAAALAAADAAGKAGALAAARAAAADVLHQYEVRLCHAAGSVMLHAGMEGRAVLRRATCSWVSRIPFCE
jgi:hypothetical protein